jgi:hypothetical protein
MWERFSSSGLEGSYVDELSKAGVRAAMEFRPRRALDPYPFLVTAVEGNGEETPPSWPWHGDTGEGDIQAGS